MFDVNFTTFEYLSKTTVPPHRANLVCSSAEIKSIVNIKEVHGNRFLKLTRKLAIFCTSKQLLPLTLNLVRELTLGSFTTSKTIEYHFWRSLCKLKRRSIIHLLLISVLKTCGKCHQQLILIPVVFIVPLELKYSDMVTRCTITLHKHNKLHPCIHQAQYVSNLPWCYSLLSVPLDMDCQV